MVRQGAYCGKIAGAKETAAGCGKLPDSEQRPLPAAQKESLLWVIPSFHHVILMETVKDEAARLWYMRETLSNGWSRNVLLAMIQSGAHTRQGKALTNFERLLPPPQSELVQQTLKDPYIFDFLTLQEPFHERELETNLLHRHRPEERRIQAGIRRHDEFLSRCR